MKPSVVSTSSSTEAVWCAKRMPSRARVPASSHRSQTHTPQPREIAQCGGCRIDPGDSRDTRAQCAPVLISVATYQRMSVLREAPTKHRVKGQKENSTPATVRPPEYRAGHCSCSSLRILLATGLRQSPPRGRRQPQSMHACSQFGELRIFHQQCRTPQ